MKSSQSILISKQKKDELHIMETRDTSIVFVPCVLTHSRPKEPHYLHVGIPVTCCESIGVMFGMLHMFYVEVVIKPFFFFFWKTQTD